MTRPQKTARPPRGNLYEMDEAASSQDLDASEATEARASIDAGKTVRVWRAGRIYVLTTRADCDAFWPQSTRARRR